MACAYKKVGKMIQAYKSLEAGIDICLKYSETTNLAITLLNASTVLSELGNHKESLEKAKQAVKQCQEELLKIDIGLSLDSGEEHLMEERRHKSVLRSMIYYNIGVQFEFLSMQKSAIEAYRKAKEFFHYFGEGDKMLMEDIELALNNMVMPQPKRHKNIKQRPQTSHTKTGLKSAHTLMTVSPQYAKCNFSSLKIPVGTRQNSIFNTSDGRKSEGLKKNMSVGLKNSDNIKQTYPHSRQEISKDWSRMQAQTENMPGKYSQDVRKNVIEDLKRELRSEKEKDSEEHHIGFNFSHAQENHKIINDSDSEKDINELEKLGLCIWSEQNSIIIQPENLNRSKKEDKKEEDKKEEEKEKSTIMDCEDGPENILLCNKINKEVKILEKYSPKENIKDITTEIVIKPKKPKDADVSQIQKNENDMTVEFLQKGNDMTHSFIVKANDQKDISIIKFNPKEIDQKQDISADFIVKGNDQKDISQIIKFNIGDNDQKQDISADFIVKGCDQKDISQIKFNNGDNDQKQDISADFIVKATDQKDISQIKFNVNENDQKQDVSADFFPKDPEPKNPLQKEELPDEILEKDILQKANGSVSRIDFWTASVPKEERNSDITREKASTFIQKFIRRHIIRKQYKNELRKIKKWKILISGLYRFISDKSKQTAQYFIQRKNKSIQIQVFEIKRKNSFIFFTNGNFI